MLLNWESTRANYMVSSQVSKKEFTRNKTLWSVWVAPAPFVERGVVYCLNCHWDHVENTTRTVLDVIADTTGTNANSHQYNLDKVDYYLNDRPINFIPNLQPTVDLHLRHTPRADHALILACYQDPLQFQLELGLPSSLGSSGDPHFERLSPSMRVACAFLIGTIGVQKLHPFIIF